MQGNKRSPHLLNLSHLTKGKSTIQETADWPDTSVPAGKMLHNLIPCSSARSAL